MPTDPRPERYVYEVGALLTIGRTLAMPDGSISLLVQGRARVEVLDWVQATPYHDCARAACCASRRTQSNVTEALMRVTHGPI